MIINQEVEDGDSSDDEFDLHLYQKAKYMIRLLQFNKNDQIQESLLAITGMHAKSKELQTFDKFYALLKDGIRLGQPSIIAPKKESVKTLHDELSYNFCQVCLKFQCVAHLVPNGNNDWAFTRIRQPANFPNIDTDAINGPCAEKEYSYLRRWAEDL